jgi:isopentenyl phosphate kinase
VQSNKVILKLGGSVITDKEEPYSFARDNLMRITREIRDYAQCIAVIVHGTGSYGKGLAREYDLTSDFMGLEELDMIVTFNHRFRELNLRVMNVLIDMGLKVVSISPSSLFMCEGGRITTVNWVILREYLSRGITPVVYGDVILDIKSGFYACSSDQMVARISEYLKPPSVLFLTDVDGVYLRYPPQYPDDPVLEKAEERTLLKLECDYRVGVGEMYYKVKCAVEAAHFCEECLIINGRRPGILKRALMGDKVLGTTVIGRNRS